MPEKNTDQSRDNAPVSDEEVAEVESGEREPGNRAEEAERAARREEEAAEG